MNSDERAKYLKPFTLTSILKEEMMNLKEDNEGVNIILKQINRGIKRISFLLLNTVFIILRCVKKEEKEKI